IRREVRKGPHDVRREMDLATVEKRIQDALAQQRHGSQLAEDCIDAARLATWLERPRAEVNGLYDRAERIAAKYGTSHQRLKCAYEWAWATFWWYEDYERFRELYEIVEERAKETQNAYELELLSNLWSLLHNSVFLGRLEAERSALSKHTD